MSNKNSDYYFLNGGGEMGALIRAKDWSKTPLGDPANWPQSLRTMVAVMLDNPFGMYIAWGSEYIQLYNDGYRPIMGTTKHPQALGISTRESFQEVWHIVGPMFDGVMKGKAVGVTDFMFRLNRYGYEADYYFDFSYSPIRKENGEVGGVLVTVIETTEKKRVADALKESNSRYISNITQAPVAMCIFRGPNYVVEIANEPMLALWDKQATDVMNKPIFEGLPEAKNQGLEPLLDHVYTTGQKFEANERPVQLPRNGKMETTYINFVYDALKESDGSISGIVAIAIEVTPQVDARSRVEESEQKVRALVENAPFPIAVYVGKEMIVELANQSIIDIWGKGNDVIGKSFKEVLPELDNQQVFDQIEKVFTTGESFHTKNTPLDLIVDGKLRTYYFNYSFTPLYDIAGNIYAVMNTGVDLTDLNIAQKQIEESERLYEAITQNTPDLIYVFDLNYRFTYANEALLKMWGRTWEDAIGKGMLEIGYEPWHAQMHEREIDQVIATRKPIRGEVSFPHATLGKRIYDYIFAPIIDTDNKVVAITGTTRDITELLQAKKQIEESEQNIRSMVLQSPIGICVIDAGTLVSEIVNDSFIEIAGKAYEEIAGKHYWETFAEAKPYYESALNQVIEKGESFYANEVEMMLIRHGKEEIIYVTFVYAPLKNIEGVVKKVAVWVLDNTPQVITRRKIEEADKRFRNTVKQAPVGIAIFRGPQYIAEMANEAYLQLVDRKEEAFIGRPLFDALPEVEETVHPLLDSVLNTGTPYHGNEVAIPVNRYGKQEVYYFDFIYYPLKEEDGKISGVIVTVTEVSEKVEARKKIEESEQRLKTFAKELELQVSERTNELEVSNTELQKMNKELESFAYISSHDLQEPLRKIQTFASRITEIEENNLSGYGKDMFNRIQDAAKRMQTLIQDLLAYSRTNTKELKFENTNLNKIIDEVKADFEEELKKNHAIIETTSLCEINIIPFQFRQLMHNLIGNSLKFSDPNRPPVIKIKCEIANGLKLKNEKLLPQNKYCHITVTDNGIGFEEQYSERIFEVFQRLNGKNEYEGNGIGLSIVKKIVENHNGIITANGQLNKGATFEIYIPA